MLRARPPVPTEADPLRAQAAWSRVAVCAIALLLIAGLGCRPRWSADGKRLTYGALEGTRHVVAERDFETNRSRKLFDIGLNDGALDMVRDPDQPRWVVVWADGTDDAVVNVRTRDDRGEEGAVHAIRAGGRNISVMLTEPVVASGYVFLSGRTINRVDLDTGETRQQGDRGLVAFPLAGGVGYIHTKVSWEIGRLDPETLEQTALIRKPADCDWRLAGAPRFDRTGERCAVTVRKGQQRAGLESLEWAILIFEGGELLTTVELEGTRSMGPIAWIDAVTLCATVVRPGGEQDRFALFETNISGSFQRETLILTAPVHEKLLEEGGVVYQLKQPLFLQPSPSPDGMTVAFTTAKMPQLPEDKAGLLLLRRNQKNRVERIPFAVGDK